MKNYLLLLLLITTLPLYAQETDDWRHWFDALGQQEDVESDRYEAAYELLDELAQNPLNLNTVTREELEQLPFLSSQQVADLMEYLNRYRPVRSLGELSMVKSLDPVRVRLLRCFVFVGPAASSNALPPLDSLLHHGHHEAVGMLRLPLYTRRGDRRGYLGYKYKHWMRYTFRYGQRVKWALLGAQDAGEPFFADRNRAGYDFYSFYVQLRHVGRISNLTVGRYRMRTGMGLILNNSFSFGKLASLSALEQTTTRISGHASRSEGYYLQGAAATLTLSRHVEVTAFASWRQTDATLAKDSDAIVTLLHSGYHRTQSEMDRKNNTSQWAAGANMGLRWGALRIGFTGLATGFDKPLQPNTKQRFRRYYPAGQHFWNISVDYSYMLGPLSVSGETATGDSHAVATLNRASLRLGSQWTLLALQRFYSYKFYSLLGRSFGENHSVTNESGIYVGASFQPAPAWTLQLYTDYAYFAWPRYQADDASHAFDAMFSASWLRGPWSVLMRYRVKLKQQNNTNSKALSDHTTQRGRMAVGYSDDRWAARTQIDIANSAFHGSEFGWMVSQTAGLNLSGLRLSAMGAYFHTGGYDSRLYVYERSFLYTFSFPSFYGEGIHYSLLAQAQLLKCLQLSLRVSTTNYFDRDHISEGYQRIDHSALTDLELQVRWKL